MPSHLQGKVEAPLGLHYGRDTGHLSSEVRVLPGATRAAVGLSLSVSLMGILRTVTNAATLCSTAMAGADRVERRSLPLET